MSNINHTKAYLLGLLVGGGKIDETTFIIDLPWKKWGMDPSRMNSIAVDILTKIQGYFNSVYGFNIDYEIGNAKWQIRPIGNIDITEIKKDLKEFGLPIGGFLLSTADLTVVKEKFIGINAENFLSGICDARASLAKSHRRFNSDAPVVSIEIPGSTKNFKFVVQLCSWLTSLGSITDQVIYNHPNFHAKSDPNYKGWKKGFKIRFLVRSFLEKHSFALQSKAIDIVKIEKSQKKEQQEECLLRRISRPSSVSVHVDQNSLELPKEVRSKLFFHYFHFCAVLNCPYAPVDEIKKIIKNRNKLISFFPRLSKGLKSGLKEKFYEIKSLYFSEIEISKQKIKVGKLLEKEDVVSKFKSLQLGIAYLFDNDLKGKRHSGSMSGIISANENNLIEILSIGEINNGLILVINNLNDRAFICSATDSKLNQKLINEKVNVQGVSVILD
jgi:hypothetical protein